MPEEGARRQATLQDLNMMCFGGMERTETQWKELLEGVGLEMVGLYKREGSRQVTVEGMLKKN